jgi:outer membrane protein assembly factor BamB
MIVFSPSHRSLCSSVRILAFLPLLLLAGRAVEGAAQGTHLWTQSRFEEFEKGTPEGVAIGSDGRLEQGPALKERLTTPATFVWSVTADRNGTTFLGTGSPATVLRVGSDGKAFTLFESKDLNVQVVRIGPDGSLYAAALPSGKVYRLDPNATTKIDEQKAKVVFDSAKLEGAKPADQEGTAKSDDASGADKPETKSHYIWDMTFDPGGRLYIATGGPAAVYRVDPRKGADPPEEFFKSDEQHIRALAWDEKGNLIAGSDGSGLVYRISPQGKGYVLFEAPRREITSLAVASDGTIYAASVGDKSHNPLPPLPVQGIGAITITIVQPGSLQAANASTSVPEGTEIYAIEAGQAPRRVWTSKDDIVYALASETDGLLALSGNRGHIFRIEPNGDYADLAHLDAQQGLCLAKGNSPELLIGTGNTGKLYTLGAAEKHEYASDVLDAGAMARFGRIEVEPGSSGYQLWTRSGNVEQPVRGWSEWEQLKDGEVVSPPGRYLQWKAVLEPKAELGSVGVNYLPVNAAPVIDDLVVVPGARLNAQNQQANQQVVNISLPSANQGAAVSFDAGSNGPLPAVKDRTAITVRWAAHDDNGDDLTYSLYVRGDGEHVWRLLKDDLTDKAYSFDATLIPDGGYQIKVVASDAPSHTPGDALTGEKVSDRFEVDTTPPVVSGLKAEQQSAQCAQPNCAGPVRVIFDAEDAATPIAHAEYSLDAGPWKYVAPVGGLSDSKRERYDFGLPAASFEGKSGEHLLTVRVYDRYDNIGLAKTVFTTR